MSEFFHSEHDSLKSFEKKETLNVREKKRPTLEKLKKEHSDFQEQQKERLKKERMSDISDQINSLKEKDQLRFRRK